MKCRWLWRAFIPKAAKALAEKYDVEMPIIMEVNKLLFENKPASEAVKDLMQREKQGKFPGNCKCYFPGTVNAIFSK